MILVSLNPVQASVVYRTTATYESLDLNSFKDGFSLLIKSDELYAKAKRLARLYAERSLQVCVEESIANIATIENQSAYPFIFYFGAKCLNRLAVTEKNIKLHETWLKYVIDYETLAQHKDFLEPEKTLIYDALLNARESLFKKSDELGLDDMRTEALARRIWNTKSKSIVMKLFEFYMKKNDQDSAKQVLKEFEPDLQDIGILEKINQHFSDEVIDMKIKLLKQSAENYRKLKRLYDTKKYSQVVPLYKQSSFYDTKNLVPATRAIAWTYAHGKEDVRKSIISEFNNLDIHFETYAWVLANRGLHEDVFLSYEKVENKTLDHHRKALRALLYKGDYAKASKLVESLGILNHAKKVKIPENRKLSSAHLDEVLDAELVYWSSLNMIRNNEFQKVLPLLDILEALDSDFKLQALYFRYRILKHELKSKDHKAAAENLVKNYPLAFYGVLVAHEEGLTHLLPFFQKKENFTVQMSLQNQSDLRILKQILFIVEEKFTSEFLTFMDKSLAVMTLPGQVLLAKHFQDAGHPLQAIKIMNNVWTLDHNLIQADVIQIAYPTDLLDMIKTHATKDLDPLLILALIRQESAFQPNAVSPSRARGLMQLLAPTAREMARALKMRLPNFPRVLFQPDVNIKLGSHYLRRMSNSYQGHLPLAFAAYNAGPGRIRTWSASRDIITQAQLNKHSEDWKQQDLWVEELPWSETRFYVKALLRNYILYKLFETYEPLQSCYRLWNCEAAQDESQ